MRLDRDEILRYIERRIEASNQWIRAAFYSDPEVVDILERLYERWYDNNEEGEPIDYATYEELEVLYERARRYATLAPYEAYAIVTRRMEEREKEEDNDSNA